MRPHITVIQIEGVSIQILDLPGLLKTKQSLRLTNRTLMEPPYRGLMEPAEVGVFRVSDGVIFSCFSGF